MDCTGCRPSCRTLRWSSRSTRWSTFAQEVRRHRDRPIHRGGCRGEGLRSAPSLSAVVDPFKAMDDEVIVRDDKDEKTNHIWHWKRATRTPPDQDLRRGHGRREKMHIPVIHVA